MIRGLDLSSCQGEIDWDKVPAEFAFIIQKATEGVIGRDPTRMRNLMEAHRTGRSVGFYHYCRPSMEPIAQVKNLWESIGDTMPDFRPAIDIENGPDEMTSAQLQDWLMRVVDESVRYFGVFPLLYTYPWWYMGRLGRNLSPTVAATLAQCPLWMADYSKGESPKPSDSPFVPSPWNRWAFWQTSGDQSTRVPGINGPVDHDVFNGDASAFKKFCGLPDAPRSETQPIVHPAVPMGADGEQDTLPIPYSRPPVEIVDDSDDEPPPQAA